MNAISSASYPGIGHIVGTLVAALAIASCADTGSSQSDPFRSEQARLSSPDRVECVVPAGAEFGTVEITLRNNSSDTLLLARTYLDGETDTFSVLGLQSRTIAPGETIEGLVQCSALSNQYARDRLQIIYSGQTQPASDFALIDLNMYPEEEPIEAVPDSIDFGFVAPGAIDRRVVTYVNHSPRTVYVSNLEVMNSATGFDLASDAATDDPITIPADGELVVPLRFAPTTVSRVMSALRLTYVLDGSFTVGEILVQLSANDNKPCLYMENEDGLVFNQADQSGSLRQSFRVSNCSVGPHPLPLLIRGIRIIDTEEHPSSPNFRLADLPSFPVSLSPDDFLEPVVRYTNSDPTNLPENAWIEIQSNDALKTTILVPVLARANRSDPPTATIDCRLAAGGAMVADGDEVFVGTHILCSGFRSYDPDGSVANYVWRTLSSNPGLRVTNNQNGTATVVVSQPGRHVFGLQVWDDSGELTEAPTRFTLRAVVPGLRIELEWTKLTDEFNPGLTDRADLDLHFLDSERGCWNDSVHDFNSQNDTPDWGLPGDSSDNPEFRPLFTGERGAERAFLLAPLEHTYRLGVRYTEDLGIGPVVATLNVDMLGIRVFADSRTLQQEGEFWDVGEFTWPARAVIPVDDVYGSIDDAPCP